MANPELTKVLRKYWYVVVIIAALIAGLVYIGIKHDVDPYELLRKYGYAVILVWTFLEGETVVVIAGMLADRISLNPWLIALCAFCGSFLSDQIMFSLGKYKGASVLQYFPSVARKIDKAAKLFKKYDIALILGFRFIYGVRNVTPILLGISGVSHKKFFFLNFIGAGVWALTFSFGGYYVGKVFLHYMEHIGHGIFYGIVAILVIVGIVMFVRSKKNAETTQEKSELPSETQELPTPQDDSGEKK